MISKKNVEFAVNKHKDFKIFNEIDGHFNIILNNIFSVLPKENLTSDQVLLFALIQRIKSNYKSINILLSYGMYLETTYIIRAVIETSIIVNSLLEQPIETIKLLEKNSNYNKYKSHKMAMTNDILKKNAEKYDFGEFKNDKITLDRISNLSISNIDIYKICYSQISNAIHINLFSIESLLNVNSNNNFNLRNQIEFSKISVYYFSFFYCLYLVCSNINLKFQLNYDLHLKKIEEKLEILNT